MSLRFLASCLFLFSIPFDLAAQCALQVSASCPTTLASGQTGRCTAVVRNSGSGSCDGHFLSYAGVAEGEGTITNVSSDFHPGPWAAYSTHPKILYSSPILATLPAGQSFTIRFEVTADGNGFPHIYLWSGTMVAFSPGVGTGGQALTEINATPPPARPAVEVVISRFPAPIVQAENDGGAAASMAITNFGTQMTPQLNLTTSSDFFSLEPSVFTLQPQETRTIQITGKPKPSGAYDGEVTVNGAGQFPPPTARVRLLSAARPEGQVEAAPANNRVDVSASSGTNPSGRVAIANRGSGTLRGILSADTGWIVPEDGMIAIGAGQTREVSFNIDRSKQPEPGAGTGSVVGSLILTYDSGASANRGSHSVPSTASNLVTVVDTVRPVASVVNMPRLEPGQIALFAPGVGRVQGSVGLFLSDVSIQNLRPTGAVPVSLLYKSGAASSTAPTRLVSVSSLDSLTPLGLADLVKSTFGVDGEVGTLQVRTSDASAISLAASIFNSSDPRGSYGSSIPVFRSDRGATAGGQLHLTGLRRNSSSHTNLYLQELGGGRISVQTTFQNATGGIVSSRTDTIDEFGLLFMSSGVPEGAVTAVMEVLPGSAGSLQAYATPVDRASGDFWSLPDWSSYYSYSPSEPLIIPVAGAVRGANDSFFRTDVALTNRGATAARGALKYYPRDGSVPLRRTVSLPSLQSIDYTDVVTSLFGVTTDTVGYLMFEPESGSMAVTSRTYTTDSRGGGTFGTGVPALPLSASLTSGRIRKIAGLEDSSTATIVARRPATFRTNVGMVETSGGAAQVKVTARFNYSTGAATARVAFSKIYDLAGREFRLANNITKDIIGESRDQNYGDIRNLALDFEVISPTGSVVFFTSATDNGTNDTILRTE